MSKHQQFNSLWHPKPPFKLRLTAAKSPQPREQELWSPWHRMSLACTKLLQTEAARGLGGHGRSSSGRGGGHPATHTVSSTEMSLWMRS